MANTFKINNTVYKATPFDFNLICELEDMGISMTDLKNKPMSAVRAYFAISSGLDKESAGLEMQSHIVNGGNFDNVIKAMTTELEKSDFFQTLSKTAEKDVATEK